MRKPEPTRALYARSSSSQGQCGSCQRSWPFVHFNEESSTECQRCRDPTQEDWRWRLMFLDMKRDVKGAQKRIRTAQSRERPVSIINRGPKHAPEATTYHQSVGPGSQAMHLPTTTPDAYPAYLGQKIAPQQLPDMPSPQLPCRASDPRPASKPLQATVGPYTSANSHVTAPLDELPRMPLGLRQLSEPQRARYWLIINYMSAPPTETIPQISLYLHYRSTIPPYRIYPFPPLLSGEALIKLVPRVIEGVRLGQHGYVCSGLKRREGIDVDRIWQETRKVDGAGLQAGPSGSSTRNEEPRQTAGDVDKVREDRIGMPHTPVTASQPEGKTRRSGAEEAAVAPVSTTTPFAKVTAEVNAHAPIEVIEILDDDDDLDARAANDPAPIVAKAIEADPAAVAITGPEEGMDELDSEDEVLGRLFDP